VRASLPLLPFLDGAFDLVLCAHLLFLYASGSTSSGTSPPARARARDHGEVRIHPVCGLGGKPYASSTG